MADRPLTHIKAIPFRGGAVTSKERAQLPLGGFSMIQNMRPRHPGFEQRGGFTRKHTVEEGTNQVMSLYQFSKGKRIERHFFAQFANGNVLEAEDNPPTVTTGGFGNDVHDCDDYTTMIPGSWGNIDDLMIYSNGVDQHQIYAGTANYVQKFVKVVGTGALPSIPSVGVDYTKEVTDGLTTTFAILDSLDTGYDYIFICTPVPANRLTWAFVAGHENATGSVGTLSYMNNASTWTDTEETDGTATAAGATLGQAGSMTWTPSLTEVPSYMFGVSGFWYRWSPGTTLDDEVEVKSLTYGSGFQDMHNVWCGIPEYAIETKFFDHSNTIYQTGNLPRTLPTSVTEAEAGVTLYSTDAITINDMAATNDKLYFNTPYPISAFYIDPGDCCNTTASTTIDAVYHWNGTGWAGITSVTDETAGISHAGWVTLNKSATERIAEQPTQFLNAKYYSYWYYFTVDKTLSSNVIISLEVIPQYDIANLGIGQCNGVWKNRALLTFDRWPQYVYISARGKPMVLNGPDSTIMRAGDGRANRVVCMLPFYNEQLVWQKEVGKEGGTVSLFQGDSPQNMREPLVLSSTIGTFNAKSAIVVDGILDNFSPKEGVEEKEKTFAFWLSQKGIFCTDGITVFRFSHNIQNYFNPKKDECIRRSSDNEHWIGYNSAENCIMVGLVSGEPLGASTATSTTPYKLVDDTAGAFTTVKTSSDHPIKHKIAVGDTVYNTTDSTSALVVSVNSATELTLDTDIMASGEGYVIYAATPNLFPVFDITDKKWVFDKYGVNLSCMTEVEAANLNVPILQYGGGVGGESAAAGVFQLNIGTNDVDIDATNNAIDAYATMELNAGGLIVSVREILLRMKAQTGNCTLTPYRNTRSGTALTLPMTAETTNDSVRRQRMGLKLADQAISLKFQNSTASQSIFLEELGIDLQEQEGH